jgi:hypothetical protein
MEKFDTMDSARRAALLKLVKGAAFAVPVLTSFAMAGLKPAEALPPASTNTSSSSSSSSAAAVPTLAEWAMPVAVTGLGAVAVATLLKDQKAD